MTSGPGDPPPLWFPSWWHEPKPVHRPSHVVTDRAGERHRITGWTDDPRVVEVACGIRVALLGEGHPEPKRCPKEADRD